MFHKFDDAERNGQELDTREILTHLLWLKWHKLLIEEILNKQEQREDAPNLLHQEPGVILDGLFTPVPIVVEQLRLLLDVVLGHQYKARCVPQHHHLQEGYSVSRFHYDYF